MTAAICQLDADVICVQEVWLPIIGGNAPGGAPGTLASRCGSGGNEGEDAGEPAPRVDSKVLTEAAGKLGAVVYRAAMCTRLALAGLGGPSGSGPGELSIALLTTIPVTGYEVLELGLAPRDDVPRVAQVVSLELAGGASFRVVNTHLTHRLTSPLQLRKLRQRLRPGATPVGPPPVPTIIAGDLNMPRLLAARSAGFAAVIRGRTWPAGRPLAQLDHVLASADVERLDGAVLPSAGSDHLPIRARLRLQPPP